MLLNVGLNRVLDLENNIVGKTKIQYIWLNLS